MVAIASPCPFPLLGLLCSRAVTPWVGPSTFVNYMSEMAGVSGTSTISVVRIACGSVVAPFSRDTALGSIRKKWALFIEYGWRHGKNGQP